jgi:hypothetical protein
MATVDAMRVANKEMKKQYKGIDIDKIEVGSIGHTHGLVEEARLTARAYTTIWRISLSRRTRYKRV